MYVPAGVRKLEWLKYFDTDTAPDTNNNNQHDINTDITSSINGSIPPPGYKYVTILPVKQFIEMVNQFNPNETIVDSFTFNDNNNGFPGVYNFYFRNDKTPQYCTILSDYYVIFDSFDSAVDSTLQSSKTMAYGEVIPTWSNTDSFIPNLDENTFPLLLNEAKSLAFFELKQTAHVKAEQEAKRGWSNVQKDKNIINRPTDFDALPNYGRGRGRTDYYGQGNWSAWRGR
jgi:hypothetical protein